MKHARRDYQDLKALDLKIPENEPVFLLRAQDCTAAETVRYWAHMQDDAYLKEIALRQADLMDRWPVKKHADCPDSEIPDDLQPDLIEHGRLTPLEPYDMPDTPTDIEDVELKTVADTLDEIDEAADDEESDDVDELKENEDFANDMDLPERVDSDEEF